MISTLDAAPRPTVGRGAASNAETPHAPGYTAIGQALARAGRPDYFGWLDHIRAAAGCTRPIRLAGDIYTIQRVGQDSAVILDHRSTDTMPDSVIYKACGNRRATVCPSCARTYQGDAYQLVHTGLTGGKGIPETVAKHPAVFATFTAPSFGTVHTRHVRYHTCQDRRRCDCRPEPCHPRRNTGLCEHGRPAVCWARHEPGDQLLGQPLCLDCYDHQHQVIWNLYSGELWHRTKQAIERHLAQLARQRGIPHVKIVSDSGKIRRVPPVRVSHAKVAEFQARGAVHFHTLLRLDGVTADPDQLAPPPAGITTDDLERAIRQAAEQITFHTPTHPDQPGGWPIAWGEQVDIRHINLTGENDVTDRAVAAYLAKYATKSTEATGHNSTRLTNATIDDYANPDGDHIARLIDACWHLGRPHGPTLPLSARPTPDRPKPGFRDPWVCPDCGTRTRYANCPTCAANQQADNSTTRTSRGSGNPYARLRRWAHMLGFGGHFLTKARRYSITFRSLREARISHRRSEDQDHAQPRLVRAVNHDEDTTLVVGVLTFAGVGWHTNGDALLANTAAALARERQAIAREELAHELGSAQPAPIPTAA